MVVKGNKESWEEFRTNTEENSKGKPELLHVVLNYNIKYFKNGKKQVHVNKQTEKIKE